MKLFHLALASVMALPVMAWADWLEVDSSADDIIYADFDNLQMTNYVSKVGMWSKAVAKTNEWQKRYDDPDLVKGSEIKMFRLYDCKNAGIALTETQWISGKTKKVLDTETYEIEFEPVEADTLGEFLWDNACDKHLGDTLDRAMMELLQEDNSGLADSFLDAGKATILIDVFKDEFPYHHQNKQLQMWEQTIPEQ